MQTPEVLIVGAGISGAVLAERIASGAGRRVLVIDRRDHVGGNCYDYPDADGLLVPRYGPHFFHTTFPDVWEYVSRFTAWHPYEHRVVARVNSRLVPVPVNIDTVNRLFGTALSTETEMARWLAAHTERIAHPRNSEEAALRRVGRELYEALFKHYTRKQWDLWPHELDASVMDRIPVRLNHDDRYFSDPFQGQPAKGYARMFERMLDHPGIEVRLSTDFTDIALRSFAHVFYTGRIDAFFADRGLEPLQYRSLRFEYETLDREFFQTHAQVNYPNTEAFTRISEPKHATGQQHARTTIIREFSTWEGEPYYPVPSERNRRLYAQYKIEADRLASEGMHFVGRLAQYKYFNMDQAVKNAWHVFESLYGWAGI